MIQIRRGLEAGRLNFTPSAGELLITTDFNKLYVGNSLIPGGIQIGGISKKLYERYTTIGEETIITIPNSKTYNVGSNSLLVIVDGTIQDLDNDYTETGAGEVTFSPALASGQKVIFRTMGF